MEWRSPDEFVVLRPPDATTTSGDSPAIRLRWLDRWWDVLVAWLPPFLTLVLVVPLVFIQTLLLPALLVVITVSFYPVLVMLASILRGLFLLCRRFAGSKSSQHSAGELLIEQNWSISLCHIVDSSKTEDLLRAVRERANNVVATAESNQARNSSVTLVCNVHCITTSAAYEAVCAAAGTTRIADGGAELLILGKPGDKTAPRFGVSPADPAGFVGLFFLAIAIIIAAQAYIVSDQERAACGTQCEGRPASYGTAFYWLLSHLVLRGDPGDLSPATIGVRLIGLVVTVLGGTTVALIIAAGAQTVRARKKSTAELEEKVRHSMEASARTTWGSMFINYRQGLGDQSVAGLHRALSKHFGSTMIFFDVRSISPGARYPDDLRAKLDASTVLIAVIQQGWLDCLNQRNNVAGTDWVRFEIGSALSTGKTVIPVLLDEVRLPTTTELPDDIADLAHRQACRLRWTSLDEDLTRLVAAIEPHLQICG